MTLVSFLGAMTPALVASAAEAVTYERHVRPILKAHCFHCHGEAGVQEGGLDLRLRRLIATGGDSGPAIVPGDAEGSLLYERVAGGEMPPEDVEQRLSEEEIATLAAWVNQGATTSHPEPPDVDPAEYLTEEERNFWSFQPVRPVTPPEVTGRDRVRTEIDRFVLARLEAQGLALTVDADRPTLIRRLYLDLLGLPPQPEDVTRFVEDTRPDAYERLVERVLQSPHYGERWGRHWLDVAGYADSEGVTDTDPVRPDAFRYRDYVIRSFNADKPFDQFIQEQLAGDEMVQPPYGELSPADLDKLIATGFLRMAPDGTASSGGDAAVARNEVVAKTVEIVSSSLLGLTVACAQCHDHRYDPISAADYYRFRAIFDPALDWKNWKTPAQRRISLYTDADRQRAKEVEAEAKAVEAERTARQKELIEATFESELAKLPEEIRPQVREARETPAKERTAEQQQLLKSHPSVNVSASSLYLYNKKAADELKKMADRAAAIRKTKPEERFVRGVAEPTSAPPPSFVFYRGDHEQPKDPVLPGDLRVVTQHHEVSIPENDPQLGTTGRRLAFARWLTSGEHPLTARVLVNRFWMHHFGRGIVETTGDFGFLGARPSHPELLDWLAHDFVSNGWSLKRLHRKIVTSTVYRQGSHRSREASQAAMQVDADNRLLWKMPVRRLEAEALRDVLLSVTGQLNSKQFGSPVPIMADKVGQWVIGIENLNAGRPGAVLPMHGEDFRRSVFVQVRRSRPLSLLDAFDAPQMTPNCTQRSASTVAPQSLMLMNGTQMLAHSEAFAQRVRQRVAADTASDEETEPAQRARAEIEQAWSLAFNRSPSEDEVAEATEFLQLQAEHYVAVLTDEGVKEPAELARTWALRSLCHALLSSNEFLYVD